MRNKKDSNVIPLNEPQGRTKAGQIAAAILVLGLFFGSVFVGLKQTYICNQKGGVLVRTLYWVACMRDDEEE